MIHATFPCAGEGCTATVIQPIRGHRYRKCADCRHATTLARKARYRRRRGDVAMTERKRMSRERRIAALEAKIDYLRSVL